jgi:hypothetical protein
MSQLAFFTEDQCMVIMTAPDEPTAATVSAIHARQMLIVLHSGEEWNHLLAVVKREPS